MAIQYTSPYNLPYPQIGDPVKEGQANMELLAKRVNTVLTDGSFPASNPDVASITARLNATEAQVAEYTASASAPNQTVAAVGTLALVTASTTNTTGWITTGANIATINKTGIYAFTLLSNVQIGGGVTGRAFVQMRFSHITNAFRATMGVNEDTTAVAVSGIHLTAGTTVTFENYQTSAGTATTNSRIIVTKLRAL